MGTLITDLKIAGAKLLGAQVFPDSRGVFEVFWENEDFVIEGLSFTPSSSYHSYNVRAGTIRAFHFQKLPYCQTKLVSCISGKAWDVILDLRLDSPTFRQWEAVELVASSGTRVLIPAGCAHGFATLEDNTTIAYLIQGDYRPEYSAVVHWNDSSLGIDWPVSNPIISAKDDQAPNIDSYLRSLPLADPS